VAGQLDPGRRRRRRRRLICLEGRAGRELLLRFLRGRGCEAAAEGETDVAVDDCDRPPDLATLVTLVEEWRSAVRVPEAVLELRERRTILRTRRECSEARRHG
jgi:hypothetical protein